MSLSEFSIINKTKVKIPSLPFAILAEDILGKNYSLSIAFVDEKKSKEINTIYRAKNKSTNILSFVLSKKEGELVLCPSLIKKESEDKNKNRGKNFREYLGFLVIHGMLHLKGMTHSSRMDRAEEKYDQKYFNRDRLGKYNHQSNSGRISKRRKKS
jgi:rRNA maturation RNase YbeY